MLIRCYSDLHGMLPTVAPCDALLIGGDVCPLEGERDLDRMSGWVAGEFSTWLQGVPAKRILLTPGNHDFIFEAQREWPDLPAELLIDESTELGGLSVHASPWVPKLEQWAFYGDDAKLKMAAEAIPKGTDIWLQHGPPFGIHDQLWRGGESVGNKHILSAMFENPPQVFLCGHIHEAAGASSHHGVLVANNSFVDEFYEPQFRHLALRVTGGRLQRSPADEVNSRELWTA
jgi:Icc-related predicted phosphoesterase